MKRLSVCTILLTCVCLSVKCQSISCDFARFDLVQITNPEDIELKYKLRINLDLSVSNPECDTIRLKTNIKISQAGPDSLVAYHKTANTLIPLECWIEHQPDSFPFLDVQFLNIILPETNYLDLHVAYDVIGTGLFFYIQGLNYPDVFAFHYDYECFYPMNIPINEVKAAAPDSMLIFCSHEKRENKEEKIYLTFINNNTFKKEIALAPNIELHVYIPDTLAENISLIERKEELRSSLTILSSHMTNNKKIDLLLMNWRDEKARRSFGRGFGNHCICDYTFSSHSMLHEIIHLALPCKISEHSKAKYFIGESIIEWLTFYISEQPENIFTNLEIANQNLYDANINHFDTWNLIYKEGPSILQKIANKSSKEVLAEAIITFLQENEKKLVCYDDFLFHLQNYISSSLIEEMDLMIKG